MNTLYQKKCSVLVPSRSWEALCNQKFGPVTTYFLLTLCLFLICSLDPHSILSAHCELFLSFLSLLVFVLCVFLYLILFDPRLWYRRLIPVIPNSTVLQRTNISCSYHSRLQYHHDEQLDIAIHFDFILFILIYFYFLFELFNLILFTFSFYYIYSKKILFFYFNIFYFIVLFVFYLF